ncbi:MAG: hypothetical protein OXD01_13365 [Gammaproteobacteria bacterium]|nr:hypothetical protein [Gammaproteobacteria bacterium]
MPCNFAFQRGILSDNLDNSPMVAVFGVVLVNGLRKLTRPLSATFRMLWACQQDSLTQAC